VGGVVTASKPNVELAYRVIDTARAAQTLKMGFWAMKAVGHGPVTLADLTAPSCGTTACLAGWTEALAGNSVDISGNVYDAEGKYLGQVQDLAAERLGISYDESEDLFFVENEELDDKVAEIFGPRPGAAS
jgi:hypothetical protein